MRRLALALPLLAMTATAALAQTKVALVIDLPGDVATMDPHVQWDTDSYSVYRNIFDNLVTRDEIGKIVPQVAAARRYADVTTIVFDLRTDIVFHDGSKLTPEDVAFSVRRIINPAFKSPQLSQFDQIISAEVTGPAQVTLRTKTPYPALMAQLVKLSILSKAYVEKVGDQAFNQQTMGSGPFKLRSWQRGVQSNLEANDAHWRGRPSFRAVTFRAVLDIPTRIADLRTGRADITRGLTPDDAEALKGEKALQILSVPTERITYMFVNAQAGPTKDKQVRQAIAMAVDRESIITALNGGYAKPVNIVLTPANFGYLPDISGWPYDPTRAKVLLKEAGAEGATIQFLTSPAYDRRLNEAVRQMLGEIGLKVEIVMLDQPTYLRRRQGTPEEAGALSQGRWSCACQDADGVIFPLFRSGSIWSNFNNPEFDAAVDAARVVLDEGKRLAQYRRAFEVLGEEVPGIGLFQDYQIYLARKELKCTPTANEAYFVAEMKWPP